MLSALALALLLAAPAPAVHPNLHDEPAAATAAPRWRGTGLAIAGGTLGVVWIGMAATATASDLATARGYDRGRNEPFCIESCYIGPVFHWGGAAALVGSAGLLGGGLHRHGRWLAHHGRGLGRDVRTGRILAGVGGGLIGAGLLGLGLGVGLQLHTQTQTQMIAVRDLGWWSATVLGIGGAALAGLGHGIVRGHRERSGRLQLAAAPLLGRGLGGLSLSGRF